MRGNWGISRTARGLAVAAFASASAAIAAAGSIEGSILTIDVRSGDRVGTYSVAYDANLYNAETGVYNWNQNQQVDIMDQNGQMIACINQMWAYYVVDPVVSLGFLVTAGAADTQFTITSALLSFDPLNPAQATASAQVGATDNDGNGVRVVGAYEGNTKSYIANYNGFVPGGTNYASLVDNQSGGAFASITQNEGRPPGGGFTPIGGPVSSMSSSFKFTLSANDSAGGTSVFVVTPEPSSLALIGLGVVALLRRGR